MSWYKFLLDLRDSGVLDAYIWLAISWHACLNLRTLRSTPSYSAPPGAEILAPPLVGWPLRSRHVRELRGDPYLPVWGSHSVFSSFQTNCTGILQGQRAKDKSSEDYRALRFCRDKKKKKIIMGVAIIRDLASFLFFCSILQASFLL